MSKTRPELKVGVFVLVGLILLGALMVEFSKGTTLFRSTYNIVLDTGNVGGLRANALVLMSGVRIGSVSSAVLSPAGTNVAIHLKIYSDYIIHDDALFKIESAGFLGDQYVAVYPGASSAFAQSHIKDLTSLVKKLRDKSDPVSKYLADNMDSDTASLVASYPSPNTAELNPTLLIAQYLNRVIAGIPIYNLDRFQGVTLRRETLELLDQHPSGQNLARLNRRLLEDAYPAELGRQGAVLKPDDVAQAQEPFNLQEVARSTAGFIERLDNTAKKVDDTINEIRRTVLNDNTLTNVSDAIANLRVASEKATAAMDTINLLIQTNGTLVSGSVSNLTVFSGQLKDFSAQAQSLLATNEPQITATISNLQASTAMLTNLLSEVESGKGLAGEVIKDQVLADDVAKLANNLAVTTSNLNRLGLWHFIWYKPKPGPGESAPPPASKQTTAHPE